MTRRGHCFPQRTHRTPWSVGASSRTMTTPSSSGHSGHGRLTVLIDKATKTPSLLQVPAQFLGNHCKWTTPVRQDSLRKEQLAVCVPDNVFERDSHRFRAVLH